jgi:hypothetical protein
MARKALEKAHASRELSEPVEESTAQRGFESSQEIQAKTKAPQGFKNLDDGKAG